MKLIKKLFFVYGVLFSANMYTVRSQLSEGDREVLKDLYSASKSYRNLSSEVRSLVDKFLWNPITLENGNTYRLFLCSKGKGREHELSLKCNVLSEGISKLRSIPDLIETDKDFAFLVKSQNSNYAQNVDSMKLLSAQQEHTAFYKKLAEGLENYKAEKKYIDSLEHQKEVSSKYIDAWKKHASLGSSVVVKSVAQVAFSGNVPCQVTPTAVSNSAKGIPTSHIPYVKSRLKAGKIIPAVAVAGAAGLAYSYFAGDKEVDGLINVPENSIENNIDNNQNKSNFSYLDQFSKFCTSPSGKITGATVLTGALVYGAYKLYESDFFAESKSKKVNHK